MVRRQCICAGKSRLLLCLCHPQVDMFIADRNDKNDTPVIGVSTAASPFK